MTQIKRNEVLTPLRGVCDTVVKGEGLIDLSERKSGATFNFLSLNIVLQDEGEFKNPNPRTYAEFLLTNDYGALEEEGYDPEVAGLIVAASELLAAALRKLIYRGGKFG